MALFKGKNETEPIWLPLPNGAQATESRELIAQTLAWLLASREMVTLTCKGYQSPRTVLVRCDPSGLEFDRPLDWPMDQEFVQVLFRDEAKVWNQVRVRVLRAEGESLHTEFPSRLIRLQRRANYRVVAPLGSTADFCCEHGCYQGTQIVDVSANGILICIDHPCPLTVGDELQQLTMTFPTGPPPEPSVRIDIRRAKVMRSDEQDKVKYFYGIRFFLERQEEEQLLHYVRQRERELLRRDAGA
ncbi:MAG: PilZ domain-containing protein [Thermodesulfobacteriota bacterium]